MMQTNRLFRRPGAAALALGLLIAATPATAGDHRVVEHGVETPHQPVVQRTDFVFDVAPDGSGALGIPERARLAAWFDALGLRYGDRVAFAEAPGAAPGLRQGIERVVGRYGLLVGDTAPVTAGEAPAGGIRVVRARRLLAASVSLSAAPRPACRAAPPGATAPRPTSSAACPTIMAAPRAAISPPWSPIRRIWCRAAKPRSIRRTA